MVMYVVASAEDDNPNFCSKECEWKMNHRTFRVANPCPDCLKEWRLDGCAICNHL